MLRPNFYSPRNSGNESQLENWNFTLWTVYTRLELLSVESVSLVKGQLAEFRHLSSLLSSRGLRLRGLNHRHNSNRAAIDQSPIEPILPGLQTVSGFYQFRLYVG